MPNDHKILIDGIKSLLNGESEINVVADASNGQEVLDLLKELEVDVILLDINMPVLDGLDIYFNSFRHHSMHITIPDILCPDIRAVTPR